MKTLLVAATEKEIRPFLDWAGTEPRSKITVLVTGAGMVATAFSLGQHLARNHYDLILNAGIAGSFDRHLRLGQLVNVTEDTFSELGAEDNNDFLPLDKLGLGPVKFRPDKSFSDPETALLKKCSAITVNKVHGQPDRIRKTVERLGITIESMEGAAVFYAANEIGIPALQIRSISNYVEKRNKEAWEIPLAISTLNDWLKVFYKQYTQVT